MDCPVLKLAGQKKKKKSKFVLQRQLAAVTDLSLSQGENAGSPMNSASLKTQFKIQHLFEGQL